MEAMIKATLIKMGWSHLQLSEYFSIKNQLSTKVIKMGDSPPAARTEAPTITRSQPREPPRPWCGEVIAHALGVLEEIFSHHSAHSVTSPVPCICPALAVPIPAGHRGG